MISEIKRHFAECVVFLCLCLAFSALVLKSERAVFLSIFSFFLPAVFAHFFSGYFMQKRLREIENEVPDILLVSSSIPDEFSAPAFCKFVAANSGGHLGMEFETAKRQIEKGMPAENAFAGIKDRNPSRPLEMAIDLIVSAMKSGADMRSAFREAAEDFTETNSILRERNAGLSIQKYTLLAGVFLVPFILGIVGGIGNDLSFDFDGFDIGTSKELRGELKSGAEIGGLIYIAEFAVLSSLFAAFLEGTPKKAAVYSVLFVPVSYIVYFVAAGFSG